MSGPPIDGGTVLVTGASAGIGQAIARQVAGRARGLVLVARREDRLAELADRLRSRHPTLDVRVMAADLGEREQRVALLDRLSAESIAVDVLVNAAGFGDQAEFVDADRAKLMAMIELNVVALVHMSRALIGGMLARGRGGILNIGSTNGIAPQPRMAVYSATKHFVTALSETLRVELRSTPVHITLVCPGPVLTEFNRTAGFEYVEGGARKTFAITAERCAREALEGFDRGAALVIPGRRMLVLMAAYEALPRFARRWVMERFRP